MLPKKPKLGDLSEGRRECAAQDAVSGPMEEHQGFEAFEVIKGVSGAVIELGLRHLVFWRGDLTHDVRGER